MMRLGHDDFEKYKGSKISHILSEHALERYDRNRGNGKPKLGKSLSSRTNKFTLSERTRVLLHIRRRVKSLGFVSLIPWVIQGR